MTDQFAVRVIADYQAPYPDPIQAEAGDVVVIDFGKKTEIQGWLWCANSAGKSGWVPINYIEIRGNQGTMLCNYNAIELTIRAGEKLTVHKEQSGFYWATNQSGKQGWVPVDHVTRENK